MADNYKRELKKIYSLLPRKSALSGLISLVFLGTVFAVLTSISNLIVYGIILITIIFLGIYLTFSK